MAATLKSLCIFAFLVLVVVSTVRKANATGECGKASPDNEALKLVPCASAATDENAAFPASCCAQVKRMGQNPACHCAVLLSDTVKASGVDLKVAITIPKPCNFASRPVGYKCGSYTVPCRARHGLELLKDLEVLLACC